MTDGLRQVIIDGMDGAGKSTLVAALRALGYPVRDRGNATHMVDRDDLAVEPDAFYVVLLAPVDICRARLAVAGKPLDEWCHTVDSLTHYRVRYRDIADRLPHAVYVETVGTTDDTLRQALHALAAHGITPRAQGEKR